MPSRWRPWSASSPTTTPSSPASTNPRTATSRSARRRAFAASPSTPTGPTSWRASHAPSKPTRSASRNCCPTATSSPGRSRRKPPLGALGRPLRQAGLSVRPGRGEAGRAGGQLHHGIGAQGAPRRVCRAGQARPVRTRHGGAEESHGVGRAALRPGDGPRPLHDRRGRRLQHGRDGEQGPQHLQHQVRAGAAGHRHRHRLPEHRPRRRPRVFPQLDRQPRHLPRLVPVVIEGRPHGVPRPGVRRRRAFARGDAHPGSAPVARRPVPRGCRADGASDPARLLRRDQQLLHRHGLRKRRRGGAHDPHPPRPRQFPQGHGPLLPAPRRPGRDLRGFRRRDAGCIEGRSRPVPPLVCPRRHAALEGYRHLRRGRQTLHADAGADRLRPPPTSASCRRPASPSTTAPCTSRLPSAWCCRMAAMRCRPARKYFR
jgi:hypothetical protein